MPNWCTNTVKITGPEELISQLWATAQKTEGLLSAIYPEPNYEQEVVTPTYPHISGTDPVDPEHAWWDWRVQNWGSKWDVGLEGLEYSEADGQATISGWFDSAWSPPMDALDFYSEQHPEVFISLYYYEPGMAFVGKWTSQGVDDYFEYAGSTSDDVREFIGEELDDMFNISEELANYEEDEQ